MGVIVNINGVLRESSSLINVNGVLRNCRTFVNVNGVLREVNSSKNDIKEEDIISFALIYHVNKNPFHPDYPNLPYNPNIPAKLSLTGETSGTCDMNSKGVVFEYDRIRSKDEGILMYTGHLYAILKDGTPVDICCIKNPMAVPDDESDLLDEITAEETSEIWYGGSIEDGDKVIPDLEEITEDELRDAFINGKSIEDDRNVYVKGISEITAKEVDDLWYYGILPEENVKYQVLDVGDKIGNLKIQIQSTLVYESNGYYIAGWNSLFSENQFIDPTCYPEDHQTNYHLQNSYPLLPVHERLDEYNSLAQIGIARSTTNDGPNMNGSYGILDQTIHWISVDGVNKPFVIEIYN